MNHYRLFLVKLRYADKTMQKLPKDFCGKSGGLFPVLLSKLRIKLSIYSCLRLASNFAKSFEPRRLEEKITKWKIEKPFYICKMVVF